MRVEENFDVSRLTSFKTGGKIKKVYFPENISDFITITEQESDFKVFGNLTNTLVSAAGYDGVIIITTGMNNYSIYGTSVVAECGLKGPKLSQAAAKEGLSGLEFMVAFPGSVGGECFMNAGAHGQSISDTLVCVNCWSREKGLFKLSKDEMQFSYRTSICQKESFVILSAEFELTRASREKIEAGMKENLDFRHAKQPSLALPNCGSVFRNPEGDSAGRLLEASGAKNLSVGGVHVWENHANFIINDGAGNSTDILEIMYKMYSGVKEKFGIELKPEVRYLGGNNEKEVEICRKLKMI
ncbi:TPA: UDP-N-acetylmuramate dehydrogenase [Candidatus Scatousia excrementigallinarum]|uniref:UDP-N-acetylenolpyruvoylglucosamine reductase n=1 Tax=Candidatus Scatousia excrementigallinarum TaxID=2840935 RepID=A0A9D1EWV2_9BACT|nr:UDP-N-acetylmuramate dehydrogenase [Candidatus Scatousia excrementigallinarum]